MTAAACLLLALGAPTAQRASTRDQSGDFKLSVDVDLVVLHTTVTDKQGHLVSELDAQNFKVYEDGVEQKLAVFRSEDVPITAGLVLDNSSSMRDNRKSMMAGGVRFVETSNPADEMFVVNFNDDYYLDLEGKDFTNNIKDLKEALDRTTTRGSTAFFDAIRASLKHLKRGTRQKRVLLVISDGVDNSSVSTFETTLHDAQQSEAALYIIKLPCSPDTHGRECRRAKRNIRKLAEVSGGMAYFPNSTAEVESLCQKISHDIRNQYVLGYYPTNRARDGSFRHVEVAVLSPKGYGKLTARTRPGYYAPNDNSAGSQ